eukprot:CAMPEP_0116013562 /NCGR_PEP_ID=MMETSP0321-20121206/5796_1 /TAXON_ID=163516 /ORGANISM="Leptocylindrus danicus var. danicus, Strain B650" /LENGTH=82 /DNA_ID=CAMNT_0003483127 /DNA_START=288 /DNA_END=536 /DNA_ORIENTATION=+
MKLRPCGNHVMQHDISGSVADKASKSMSFLGKVRIPRLITGSTVYTSSGTVAPPLLIIELSVSPTKTLRSSIMESLTELKSM